MDKFWLKALGITSYIIIQGYALMQFSVIGFYLLCITASFVAIKISNFKGVARVWLASIIFCATWLLLVDKAFEWGGKDIAFRLIDYSNKKAMPMGDYPTNITLRYTPVFTRYHYHIKTANPKSIEDVEVSYTDISGNTWVYYDKSGDFEKRKPLYTNAP